MIDKVFNVLFICTHNSARSIMAEGLLNRAGQGRFRAFSAGSDPRGEVHPLALLTLERLRLPTEGYRSKSWGEFAQADAPAMDFVLTVCDKAAGEVCPTWPGQPVSAHWGVPDPLSLGPDLQAQRKALSNAYLLLHRRISIFLALPVDKLDRLSLQHELTHIGQLAEPGTGS